MLAESNGKRRLPGLPRGGDISTALVERYFRRNPPELDHDDVFCAHCERHRGRLQAGLVQFRLVVGDFGLATADLPVCQEEVALRGAFCINDDVVSIADEAREFIFHDRKAAALFAGCRVGDLDLAGQQLSRESCSRGQAFFTSGINLCGPLCLPFEVGLTLDCETLIHQDLFVLGEIGFEIEATSDCDLQVEQSLDRRPSDEFRHAIDCDHVGRLEVLCREHRQHILRVQSDDDRTGFAVDFDQVGKRSDTGGLESPGLDAVHHDLCRAVAVVVSTEELVRTEHLEFDLDVVGRRPRMDDLVTRVDLECRRDSDGTGAHSEYLAFLDDQFFDRIVENNI